jgi:hypothetical protein
MKLTYGQARELRHAPRGRDFVLILLPLLVQGDAGLFGHDA